MYMSSGQFDLAAEECRQALRYVPTDETATFHLLISLRHAGKKRGEHSTIPFRWYDKDATLTIGTRQGSFPGMQNERTFRVVLVKPGRGSGNDLTANADQTVHYAGKEISIHLAN
jgi:hypothetical protein